MIDSLYNDNLNIYRVQKTVNEYGRTVQKYGLYLENIKCRLSQLKSNPTQIGVINQSKSLYKIFVGIDVDIRQNDNLIVEKSGIKYYFKASKVIKYYDFVPHQEIVVEEVERNAVETG